METTTIHPAEAYLRNEQNSTSLYVRIAGQRRRLFINRNENVIGIIAPRKRKSGYIFTDWASIEKIYYPSSSPEDAADIGKKQVLKYQKLARLATHTNDWLRKIANADLDKSLYENRITTGTRIDGKCIGCLLYTSGEGGKDFRAETPLCFRACLHVHFAENLGKKFHPVIVIHCKELVVVPLGYLMACLLYTSRWV